MPFGLCNSTIPKLQFLFVLTHITGNLEADAYIRTFRRTCEKIYDAGCEHKAHWRLTLATQHIFRLQQ